MQQGISLVSMLWEGLIHMSCIFCLLLVPPHSYPPFFSPSLLSFLLSSFPSFLYFLLSSLFALYGFVWVSFVILLNTKRIKIIYKVMQAMKTSNAINTRTPITSTRSKTCSQLETPIRSLPSPIGTNHYPHTVCIWWPIETVTSLKFPRRWVV